MTHWNVWLHQNIAGITANTFSADYDDGSVAIRIPSASIAKIAVVI
jgi:hypothetical protein